MILKIMRLIFIYIFLSFPLYADKWFSEYWQQIFWKTYESESIGVRTFVRFETGDRFNKIRTLMLSEQLAYKVNPEIGLEIHYTYIHGHPLSNPVWRWVHRLELEANKIFFLSPQAQIITRNRLELRWREKINLQPDVRFRQRTMFFVSLKNVKPLKAFSFFNEIFYDISRNYIDQNRFCPCQLTFEITNKIDLDIFLIFRLLDENTLMRKSVVLGSQLNF